MPRINCCQDYNNPDCICNICSVELDETVSEVGCENKHFFHTACIEEWLRHNFNRNPEYNPTCPICRRPYTEYGCGKNITTVDDFKNNLLNERMNEGYDVEDDDLSLITDPREIMHTIRNLNSHLMTYRENSREAQNIRDEIQRLRERYDELNGRRGGKKYKYKNKSKKHRKKMTRKNKSKKHRRRHKRYY